MAPRVASWSKHQTHGSMPIWLKMASASLLNIQKIFLMSVFSAAFGFNAKVVDIPNSKQHQIEPLASKHFGSYLPPMSYFNRYSRFPISHT